MGGKEMSKINYAKIYDHLYKHYNYHGMAKNHGQKYVNYICRTYTDFNFILEVGCSNGIAVRKFRESKKRAWGIDASEVAVRAANEIHGGRQCLAASAHDLPFKDKLFDAVFSCDCIEHTSPDDAHAAISEMSRVAKKYIFIVIDTELERNTEHIDKAKKDYPKVFAGINNLHMTVKPLDWWLTKFSHHGFKKIAEVEELLVLKHD
jgi:ubiquinone/menaquinone biosynthesis C-methylase UbiE